MDVPGVEGGEGNGWGHGLGVFCQDDNGLFFNAGAGAFCTLARVGDLTLVSAPLLLALSGTEC